MIVGIGADIVRVARVEGALQRHGERFARRVLSSEEWLEYGAEKRPARFLAKRFAAKEAAVKALGTGFREGVTLGDIAVVHDRRGKPGLSFTGRAAEVARELGVGETHLSIADEQDYAVAFVTLLSLVIGSA